MSPNLQNALQAIGVAERDELKVFLADLVNKEIPALVAAEAADIGGTYGPIISIVFQALYPKVQDIATAKIATMFPNA